jgi:hypothetical protein
MSSKTGIELEFNQNPQVQECAGFVVFNDVTRQSASCYFPEGIKTFQQCLHVLESFVNSQELGISAFWPNAVLPFLLIDGEGARLMTFGVECTIRDRVGR